MIDARSSLATQIGITSFTYAGCGGSDFPDVFTDVAFYATWITEQLTSTVCDGPRYRGPPTPAPVEPTHPPSPTDAPGSDDSSDDCWLGSIFSAVSNVSSIVSKILPAVLGGTGSIENGGNTEIDEDDYI